MTTYELGGRVDNNISPMLERLHEIGCREGIIYDERQPILVCNIGNGLNVQCIKTRIADSLGKNGFCAFVDSWSEVLRITAVDESNVDAEFGKRIVEQVICAT